MILLYRAFSLVFELILEWACIRLGAFIRGECLKQSLHLGGGGGGGHLLDTRRLFEVFSFSIMESSFCFTDVEIIAIPATGFVNFFRFLRTIQAALVWKQRFDAAIILKNYLEVDKRVEIVYT